MGKAFVSVLFLLHNSWMTGGVLCGVFAELDGRPMGRSYCGYEAAMELLPRSG